MNEFRRLESLTLRSFARASGQWLFKSVVKDLMSGLYGLSTLRKFSLKHDCTNEIIKCICKCNRWNLQCIDIECSKHVNDKSISYILMCSNINEINIFQCGFSDEGKGQILNGLPKLVKIPKGDFLCDALAWIEDEDPIYMIDNFFPSQKYFFHEDWQMEMVSSCCPYISKMFFIFHEKCVPDYLVLLPFASLSQLDLFGGHFFQDKISELLYLKGQQIVKLALISVKGIDYKALALMTINCKKLESLTLNNCQLVDYEPTNGDMNSDEEYEKRQAYINMAKEAHEMVENFASLEELNIQSAISSLYFGFICKRALKLKVISVGPKNEISDESMVKIFIQNPFTDLEEFHIEKCELSIMTLNMLINNCDHLRAIGDLQKWSRLDPIELSKFREMIRTENFDLDTSSNQRLRKYLDLREFERKTYINLVAGPFLERLKMAERQSHALL